MHFPPVPTQIQEKLHYYKGAELRTFCVPLHKIHLSCDLVTGSVVVGVRPSLPIPGVSLILSNDLAGGQVVANSCVSNVL